MYLRAIYLFYFIVVRMFVRVLCLFCSSTAMWVHAIKSLIEWMEIFEIGKYSRKKTVNLVGKSRKSDSMHVETEMDRMWKKKIERERKKSKPHRHTWCDVMYKFVEGALKWLQWTCADCARSNVATQLLSHIALIILMDLYQCNLTKTTQSNCLSIACQQSMRDKMR